MRTNIVIDDDLMRTVLELTEIKTKRQAVDTALRLLLRMASQERLRGLRGSGWEGDLEAMRTD